MLYPPIRHPPPPTHTTPGSASSSDTNPPQSHALLPQPIRHKQSSSPPVSSPQPHEPPGVCGKNCPRPSTMSLLLLLLESHNHHKTGQHTPTLILHSQQPQQLGKPSPLPPPCHRCCRNATHQLGPPLPGIPAAQLTTTASKSPNPFSMFTLPLLQRTFDTTYHTELTRNTPRPAHSSPRALPPSPAHTPLQLPPPLTSCFATIASSSSPVCCCCCSCSRCLLGPRGLLPAIFSSTVNMADAALGMYLVRLRLR